MVCACLTELKFLIFYKAAYERAMTQLMGTSRVRHSTTKLCWPQHSACLFRTRTDPPARTEWMWRRRSEGWGKGSKLLGCLGKVVGYDRPCRSCRWHCYDGGGWGDQQSWPSSQQLKDLDSEKTKQERRNRVEGQTERRIKAREIREGPHQQWSRQGNKQNSGRFSSSKNSLLVLRIKYSKSIHIHIFNVFSES